MEKEINRNFEINLNEVTQMVEQFWTQNSHFLVLGIQEKKITAGFLCH